MLKIKIVGNNKVANYTLVTTESHLVAYLFLTFGRNLQNIIFNDMLTLTFKFYS